MEPETSVAISVDTQEYGDAAKSYVRLLRMHSLFWVLVGRICRESTIFLVHFTLCSSAGRVSLIAVKKSDVIQPAPTQPHLVAMVTGLKYTYWISI